MSDQEKRDALITGLRELAQFYADHPDVPLPTFPTFAHCVLGGDDETGPAEVETIAAAMGAEVEYGKHVKFKRQFGGLTFDAYYVSRESSRWHAAYSTYIGAVEPDGSPS